MAVIRWVFTDPATADTYTVERNPDGMSSPHRKQQTTAYSTGVNGRLGAQRGPVPPLQWQFEGSYGTQAHYDALLEWASKPNPIRVTDHLGRTWDVLLLEFVPEERRPTPRSEWRGRYVVKGYLLGRYS